MYALCKILRFSSRKNSQIALKMLSQTDPSQTQFFNEPLILVDELDQIQGQISKFDAHVKRDGRSPLHRAFSLFHFNSKNQLLLQQRSHLKVTFPNLWTNSCCSHPLYKMDEMDGKIGACIAAARRAKFECGLNLTSKEISHMARIIYSSDCSELFSENELDHCVVSRTDHELKINNDEISNIKWLNQEDLVHFVKSESVTPWFKLIAESGLLDEWWKNLDNLETAANDKIINL